MNNVLSINALEKANNRLNKSNKLFSSIIFLRLNVSEIEVRNF